MKRFLTNALVVACASFALVSCNKASKMIEGADQVSFVCNPEVLEVVAGNIDVTVDVTFPEEYFLPKAILEVTPVIRFAGKEAEGKKLVYQGEKITENYKTVTEKGATISEKLHFEYQKGMEKCELVARAVVNYKGKLYEFPTDIKIADGANTTYMLVETDGTLELMPDGYQDIIPETAEAQILYLINSSEVRSSQLKTADVKDFQETLKALAEDERREIKGTEILAYASPDGAEDLNNRLSSNREKSANKAFDQVTKKLETGAVTSKSIGEDWEGFKELVNASDLEDKDLIIRVLSMYSDPNVREREIKNMSAVYTSLAKNVLPQLRRARFITNVEYTNYTAEELADLVENNIDVLDEAALLRAAANAKDAKAKHAIYAQAIKKFNSDKARYNDAAIYLMEGKDNEAEAILNKLADNEYVRNAKGVLALHKGKLDEAANYFNACSSDAAKANLGVVDILNGKYADAVKHLEPAGGCNLALAYILTNDLAKASAAIKGQCSKCVYKRAIIAARQGNVAEAKAQIEKLAGDEELARRAVTDIEFAKIR